MENEQRQPRLTESEQCSLNKLQQIIELFRCVEQMTDEQFEEFYNTAIDDGFGDSVELFRQFRDSLKKEEAFTTSTDQSEDL